MYDRYVTIKNHLRKIKYNPKKLTFFNVVFNSIFLKANKDLVTLLDAFGLNKNKIDGFKMTEKFP